MRLLVTNDDGVDSVFLHELVRALIAADHEVFVVAPKLEQSWTGASKSRHKAVHSAEVEHELKCPTWAVDGTPSDCVNIALDHLLPAAPDAVVSGMNAAITATCAEVVRSSASATRIGQPKTAPSIVKSSGRRCRRGCRDFELARQTRRRAG